MISMSSLRYIVFDDASPNAGFGENSDQFADALRLPLAAIGVRVVKLHRAGTASSMGGFQGRGLTRNQYDTMLNAVDRVVAGVIGTLAMR
jgi:hypothetical protein